jgi:uncharacterized membrane protein HdeD (DUF308 family)
MAIQNLTDDLRKHDAAWSIFMGILTALLGLFLIAYPLAAATITTVLFGLILILVGIVQLVFALHSHTAGKFFGKVLLGVLYGLAGVLLAFLPLAGVAALTVLLGTVLLVYAGVAIATAFEMRPVEGWGWFLFDAIISFLMAMLILTRWPSSSFWAIGTLVGVAVLMGGISRIMIASGIRRAIPSVEQPTRRAA